MIRPKLFDLFNPQEFPVTKIKFELLYYQQNNL